jgi:hypothetical protein
MAPKSKKVETGKVASQPAGISKSASEGAPPTAPIVAGDEETPATSQSTHSDTIESSDFPAPPSASPPLPTASHATQAIAPANSGARRLDVASLALQFDTADAALSDGLIGRESLEIKNDDFLREKSGDRPKYWVKKLMQAFAVDYLGDPEDTRKNSPVQKVWYARWQRKAHVCVVAIFEMKDQSHLEKCCWYLFDAIIKAHELGVLTMAANNWSSSKLKCSKRLAATVAIIGKYAPVRLDVLRLWHIDEVAANPEAFIKRKLINCWNNGIRAEQNAKKKNGGKAVVQEAEDGEEAQAAADVEEEGEEQAVADEEEIGEAYASADAEEDGEAQASADEPHAASARGKGWKRALPPRAPAENKTTVDGTKKSGDNTKGKKNTTTKRARSATPEPRETQANKKPATARKRPGGKKAPVAVGTKGRSGDKAASAGAEAEQTI